jgi:signal transduction histidine kinase
MAIVSVYRGAPMNMETRQAKILIVDDTPTNMTLLTDLLEYNGYRTIEATSGPMALDQLNRDTPDLVLLDVRMPEMSGYEVCKRIREKPDTTLLPVIMMTAFDPAQERINGIEAGADDFLTRPINHQELLARVRSLLRVKTLHDAVKAHAGELAEWNKKLEVRLSQEAKLAEVARSLADITHEVKNLIMPVVIGTGLLETELKDHFAKLPQAEQEDGKVSQNMCKEITEMLMSASQRIQDRVKEIGDCVKNISTPPNFSSCQVTGVVESVLKTLRLVANERRILLRTEGLESLPPIRADERRLFNIFYNLLNNAIPEVPSGGSVTVKGHVEPESQILVFSVADTGRGMPSEVRESLFTNRVISRKHGGTGLGTRIVKDVVDAHGGWIKVESEEGKGTTFVFGLPFEPPRQDAKNA